MIFGKYINKYYKKYIVYFIIGIVTLCAIDWIQLYLPEFLGAIVKILEDNPKGVPQELFSDIYKLVLEIIGVGIIMFAGRLIWRFALFGTSLKIESNLRDEMFTKAEKLSNNYYRHNKVGNIMAWFSNDISTIEESTGFGIVMVGDAVFMSAMTLYKMFSLNWLLSLIALIPVIFIAVWGAFCEKIMQKNWDNRQKAFDNLYDFTQENFTGIRVIKAFVKEKQEIHAFAKVAKKNYDTNIKFARISVILDVLIEIIIALIIAVLMFFGGMFVYKAVVGEPIIFLGVEITLQGHELVTFIGYFDSLIWPMIALGQIISMHSRAKASLNRISAFLDTEEEVKNPENPEFLENCKGDIEFRNFSFKYPSGTSNKVNNISLKINAGESIGVVGRIASGKTTVFVSLLRLYNYEEGTLFVDGHDVMKLDLDSLRSNIAYCPQDNFLFSTSIDKNIGFSDPTNSMSREKVVEAAKFADIHDNIMEFKDGYDTVSGERGTTLSGGQKERISIARAYAKNAPIMVLDDSVSAVDIKTEKIIMENIRELRKGKTTIVVASRVSTVAHLDRILVLTNGEVEAFGTHKELMKVSPTYQKMVYLQDLENQIEEEGK